MFAPNHNEVPTAIPTTMLSQVFLETELNKQGYCIVPKVLSDTQCEVIKNSYTDADIYRSTVRMARYSFGKGEYKYYNYPLPRTIEDLRTTLYPVLASTANTWNKKLKIPRVYPETHTAYLSECHAAGQTRPTPLILKYNAGDYNCLHQDLYGEMVFPLQIAVLLNNPDTDFDGGEFVLTEQRPRMQSRTEVVPLKKGDMLIFPVNERPIKGKKGYYRAKMRHGVSVVRRGERHVLGIIFHDAM